ncbi:Diaminobutyrate--2-oxoglutarate transaminase [Lentibacillus sp. JNUCC-1]|nr:Diaminobutyrate--2-oxoglutarate transaminase [Lentibacillus sp. JNUCC-1]
MISDFTKKVEKAYPALQAEARGRGMFQGVACGLDGAAEEIIKECFKRGLVMETSGPNDEVFEFLAPLIIDQ